MNRRIGLIDVDSHHFPNLCLMKLSAFHKSQGDTVEWHDETAPEYDKKLIISATSRAEKAIRLILNIEDKAEEE